VYNIPVVYTVEQSILIAECSPPAW